MIGYGRAVVAVAVNGTIGAGFGGRFAGWASSWASNWLDDWSLGGTTPNRVALRATGLAGPAPSADRRLDYFLVEKG